jgi:hypothetical protein
VVVVPIRSVDQEPEENFHREVLSTLGPSDDYAAGPVRFDLTRQLVELLRS